jgi:hypothetical protein
MTREAELTEEGGAVVLRCDSDVEEGPPWLVMASEVTGSQRSGGGGGVLRQAVLRGPEEMTVELSTASMSEQGKKREAGKSWLSHVRKGKRGVRRG